MTPAKPLSCDQCQDLLTELLCGELSDHDERRVRGHARSCARCGEQLTELGQIVRVAQAMPLSSPSADVEERIMTAAKNALVGRPLRPIDQSAGTLARVRAWAAKLGTWAMSPQVAMASLLVLMVGIGLLAWPLGEKAELDALRPADGRAGRDQAAATATSTPLSEPGDREAVDEEQEELAIVPEGLGYGRGQGSDKGGQVAEKKASRSVARPRRKLSRKQPRSRAVAQDALHLGPSESEARMRPEPAPAFADRSVASSVGKTGSGGAAQNAEAPVALEAEAEAAGAEALLQRAIGWVQAGKHSDAIAVLTPLAKDRSPLVRSQARLWLARAYRAKGDCKRALTFYGPIAYSSNASKATLEEAADCLEQTGEPDKAAALRERAALR